MTTWININVFDDFFPAEETEIWKSFNRIKDLYKTANEDLFIVGTKNTDEFEILHSSIITVLEIRATLGKGWVVENMDESVCCKHED